MRYELSKILGEKRLCLLFLFIALGNALLFYEYCMDDSPGYTMLQMQEMYRTETIDTLRERHEELREQMGWGNAYEEDVYESDALLTGDLYCEYKLAGAVLERMEQAERYSEYRQQLVGDALIKLKLGLLGDSTSFSGRSLARGAGEYEELAAVEPETSFSGGIEVLVNWHATDLCLLLFGLGAGLFLLTYEKGLGVNKLTRPARYGQGRLYLRKYAAMLFFVSAGFVVLYGTNVWIGGKLFGFGNLGRAVQSVYGYNGCPMEISVGSFLVRLLLLKYIWTLSCATLLFFLCTLTGTAAVVALLTVAAVALAFFMGESRLWWLRCFSLKQLACVEQLFQGAVYLNFFGNPIRRIPVAVLCTVLMMAASLGAGIAFYCMTPGAHRLARRWDRKRDIAYAHTGLFGHELHKLFFMCKGGMVLLLLLLLQLFSHKDFYYNNTEYEYFYRGYSLILEGESTAEKAAYLAGEQERFAALFEQMDEYAERYGSSMGQVTAVRELQELLIAWSPFERANRQYESLGKGQSYLYQTGYERLLNSQGRRDDLINMAKFLFALVLVLSNVFAVEGESGVEMLQRTAGREREVFFKKMLASGVYMLIAAGLAFLPQYIAVFSGYGEPELFAQANSITLLAELPPQWSVLGVFAGIAAIRLLLGGAAGGLTALVSTKTKNTVIALLISLVLVLSPIGVALYFYG